MTTLIQDSIAGHFLRILTNARFFKYAEERDPSLWKRYTNIEKSSRLAYHGRTGSVNIPDGDTLRPSGSSESGARAGADAGARRIPSSAWWHGGSQFQGLTGTRIDPEKGKDVYLVDWWDENDPEVCFIFLVVFGSQFMLIDGCKCMQNPQNWPLWKKCFVTSEICLLTFSVYIGSAIFTPGIPTLMEEFGISEVVATLGLTLFVAGYGLGPLLWSPMSEIPQIGRNPVYIATLAVFVALQVPTALAGNLGTLLAFRFLTGLFGSPALATVCIGIPMVF